MCACFRLWRAGVLHDPRRKNFEVQTGNFCLLSNPARMTRSVDLSYVAGLPLQLDLETGRLELGTRVEVEERSVRRRQDMEGVLAEPSGEGPVDLYVMYRRVGTAEVVREAARRHLRYDLTVLHPGTVGREFIKTKGHYHPLKPGTAVTFPEVYEVLYGEALYLLQTEPSGGAGPEQVVLVQAGPGDKVVIPPGYGHITINPGPDWLVMSNWVSSQFQSLYEPMERTRGGAVYVLKDGHGLRLIPNPVSPPQRSPVLVSAREIPTLGLVDGVPLYRQLSDPSDPLMFLNYPESLMQQFEEVSVAWETAAGR